MDKETLSLIRAYLEKAKGKLKTASDLVADGAFDDAVSRAYYAAFHAASAVLLTEGLTADSHRGLLNSFGLHFVKTGKIGKKYARYLSNLKDDRESGDYEVFSTVDETIAKKALTEAFEFVKAIEKYLNGIIKP